MFDGCHRKQHGIETRLLAGEVPTEKKSTKLVLLVA